MKAGATALIFLFFSHLPIASAAEVVVVEEVVAVVDRTPLLASDIDLAEILGLVERAYASDREDHRSVLLDARIRLEVQFRDLEASGVLYRLDLDVVGIRDDLVASAGGLESIAARLDAAGLDETDIDELALRVCAVNAYAEQRLRPRISVSLAEIETAYRRLAVELESQGDEAPPLTAVDDQLHRLVTERKLNDEIERWYERASAEHEITRFVR